MIASAAELSAYLAAAQEQRVAEVGCELTPALSACMTDAALREALVTGLPMAQGVQCRILRSRGRGTVLTAKVRWREGVRMLDHWRNGREPVLTGAECFALATAGDIAQEASRQRGEEVRFRHVYDWVCRNIRYVHTAPGRKGYEQLVGAAGVLAARQANCQGFADVLYLLCGLCGIECEYRCGRGERRLHVWNAVRIGGEWRAVDASKGARTPPGSSADSAPRWESRLVL